MKKTRMTEAGGKKGRKDEPLGMDDMCMAACIICGAMAAYIYVRSPMFIGNAVQAVISGLLVAYAVAAGLWTLAERIVRRDRRRSAEREAEEKREYEKRKARREIYDRAKRGA